MPDLPLTAARLLDLAPVVPVVVLEDAEQAVPLARALVAGGLPVIEVTLRTMSGLAAISAIAEEVPDAVVGAGTVNTPGLVKAAADAGARFLVSPGWTVTLLEAFDDSGLPALPGVSTVSEMLGLLERGRREMKFFPAEASGGVSFLKSVASPLPEARFCPTGGIRPDTRRVVPGPAERRLRRRHLADPGRRPLRRRLVPHRVPRRRSRRPALTLWKVDPATAGGGILRT